MTNQLKEFFHSYNFVFVLITLGFIIVVALLVLENRRDNLKLRLLNEKIKSLISVNIRILSICKEVQN